MGILSPFSLSFALHPISIVKDAFVEDFALSVKFRFREIANVVATLIAFDFLWDFLNLHSVVLQIFLLESLVIAVIEKIESLCGLYLALIEISLIVCLISINSDAAAMRKTIFPLSLVITIQIFEVIYRALLDHIGHT